VGLGYAPASQSMAGTSVAIETSAGLAEGKIATHEWQTTAD
jgi:hypothetical protein